MRFVLALIALVLILSDVVFMWAMWTEHTPAGYQAPGWDNDSLATLYHDPAWWADPPDAR